MGLRNDYRVSKIFVLCKDCGNDVGLYPARHKCSNVERPYLPTLCSTTSNWSEGEDLPDLVASPPTSTTVTRQASDSSMESGKWSFFKSSSNNTPRTATVKNNASDDEQEEPTTSYFDNYATNLKSSGSFNNINDLSTTTNTSNGKKLWGRMKENEKWKELIADKKKENNKPSGKLWDRIINATMPNSFEERYHDAGPDSDDEGWEGETHVSRILREYHQSQYKTLPQWLYDDRTPIASIPINNNNNNNNAMNNTGIYRSKTTRPNGRRLWQTSEDNTTSARERERQALRASTNISRTQSERIAPSLSNNNRPSQRASFHHHNNEDGADQIYYGSIAPRRTNTTRTPSSKLHYLYNNNNNISTPVVTAVRSKNYF